MCGEIFDKSQQKLFPSLPQLKERWRKMGICKKSQFLNDGEFETKVNFKDWHALASLQLDENKRIYYIWWNLRHKSITNTFLFLRSLHRLGENIRIYIRWNITHMSITTKNFLTEPAAKIFFVLTEPASTRGLSAITTSFTLTLL